MCGIAGFSGSFAAEVLPAMVAAISHRGPDDNGIWLSSDRQTGLGHARLSIIDLSPDAHQPMTNEDRSLWLVFNGEIYNFAGLRQKLIDKGHRFVSRSDSEVLLHLYEEHGPDMLPMLNGIFAFAIFDTRQRSLFIARDHLGVKPLYIAEMPAGTAFCSELKGLIQCPGIDRRIDLAAVNAHLAYIWCPAPMTMFRGVRKLLPGGACIIENGHMTRQWQWYRLPYDGGRHELSFERTATALTEHLEEAVRRQLIADVPVGAFLSGGLDSSAVVAMMRRQMPDAPIRCYSIGFSDDSDVEGCPADLPYAIKVARHLNVDLTTIRVDPEQLITRISELIWFLDEPQADPAPVNAMIIAEKARADGIKVLLSGAGGDDIFTGYRRHLAIKLEAWWRWLPQPIRVLAGRLASKHADVRNPWMRRVVKVLGNAHLSDNDRLLAYYQWSSDTVRKNLFNEACRDEAFASPVTKPLVEALQEIPAEHDQINQMLFLDSRFFLPDHNLNYTDKTCMRYGVEARVPLLDPDLVAFASRIPTSFKQKNTTGKAIFKKAMEPFLPHEVIYRPKTAFGAPLRRWVQNDLRSSIDCLLAPEVIAARGIFSPTEVSRLIAADRDGRIDGSYSIFSLLCIEIWCKLFIDGTAYGNIKI